MATINNVNMPNFSETEFHADEIKLISPKILKSLQLFRTEYGDIVSPSLAKGAQARTTGRKTSEHFVIKEYDRIIKDSTGLDLFPEGNIFKAWCIALKSPHIKRVGIYFDTNNNRGVSAPMIHIGLKNDGLIWFRDKGKYVYPHTDEKFFDKLLKKFYKLNPSMHR